MGCWKDSTKQKIDIIFLYFILADSAEKNNYMTNSFTSGDGMTSRGITFRDPETGVLYLQTQLLQVSSYEGCGCTIEDYVLFGLYFRLL